MTTRASTMVLCVACLVLAAAMTGCDAVIVSQPIGEPVDAETARSFEGVWAFSGVDADTDKFYFVKSLADGRLRLAWVEDVEDGFKVTQTTAVVTRHGDAYLLHFQDPDPNESRWMIVRVAATPEGGDHAVLFFPVTDVFAEAVTAGELAGEVKSGQGTTVHLTGDETAIRAFLDPAKVGQQFHIDTPLVARRLTKRAP